MKAEKREALQEEFRNGWSGLFDSHGWKSWMGLVETEESEGDEE